MVSKKPQLSRREILGGAIAGFALLAKPGIVRASSLNHNDIFNRQANGKKKAALALNMDLSNSMSREEMLAQRDGTANAFRHINVRDAVLREGVDIITGEPTQGITACVTSFGDKAKSVLDWAVLETEQDMAVFADHLEKRDDLVYAWGKTNIIASLIAAREKMVECPHQRSKDVCDISGDGFHNAEESKGAYMQSRLSGHHEETRHAMNLKQEVALCAEKGMLVNCFAMIDGQDDPVTVYGSEGTSQVFDLEPYMKTFLQSPRGVKALMWEGGFTMSVSKRSENFKHAYTTGIRRKLIREIG